MIYFKNKTYIRIHKHEATTESGIHLLPDFFDNRKSCAIGKVVGIGIDEKPIKADYVVGDLVVFQKNAATGSGIDELCDLVLSNIDILAKLSFDGTLIPLNTYTLCEFQEREEKTPSGIILTQTVKSFSPYGIIKKIGSKVTTLEVDDKVVMDDMSGSYVITDSAYKISDVATGSFKNCIIYDEKHILAKEV